MLGIAPCSFIVVRLSLKKVRQVSWLLALHLLLALVPFEM
jgi:hypothetical protein